MAAYDIVFTPAAMATCGFAARSDTSLGRSKAADNRQVLFTMDTDIGAHQ